MLAGVLVLLASETREQKAGGQGSAETPGVGNARGRPHCWQSQGMGTESQKRENAKTAGVGNAQGLVAWAKQGHG